MRKIATILLLFFLVAGTPGAATLEESKEKARMAEELYSTGYLLIMLGYYQEAIQLFEKSLAIKPTAEAYTFLGWAYSHLENYKQAIEEAEKAIRIDPDFGNPYNDIGVYLIEQGKEDEAIPYLEKAMRAKRYCCYQFPHFNMGKIYIKKKMYTKARQEFEKALEIDPNYLPALEGLKFLRGLGLKDT